MESERIATGMDEYVEREEIRRAYEKLTRSYVNGDPYIADWRFDEMIENLHASDVAPVAHGWWKYLRKQNIAVCTNCSFERDLDANFGDDVVLAQTAVQKWMELLTDGC